MTVEDAVLLLLAAAAVISLFLGLAQALEGRAPAPGRRRRPPPSASPPAPAEPASSSRMDPEPADAVASTIGDRSTADAAARVADAMENADAPAIDPVAAAGSPSAADVSRIVPQVPLGTIAGPELTTEHAGPPPGARAEEDVVADAARLLLNGRGRDALDLLLRDARPPELEPRGDAFVATARWAIAGLAHIQSGEPGDARVALDAAGRLATASSGAACPAALAELAPAVARQLLEEAARGSEHGLVLARLAAAWLRSRPAGATDDGAAAALRALAADLASQAHARATTALVEARDFAGACREIQAAAELDELSATQARALLELVTVPLRREIDRLTAAAVRGIADEARAVAGLGQAEILLGSIPEEPVPLPHRSAMARRIWRAYTKLGFRRLGAGELDSAADALFRALTMKGVGRQRQVRDALVRTLEALGDQRAAAVSALLSEGDRAGASRVVAGVEAAIQRARAEGVPAEELEVATAKLRLLAGRLESEAASR